MPDEADMAADLVERERAALIARHLARRPPPTPRGREPSRLDRVMDTHEERER